MAKYSRVICPRLPCVRESREYEYRTFAQPAVPVISIFRNGNTTSLVSASAHASNVITVTSSMILSHNTRTTLLISTVQLFPTATILHNASYQTHKAAWLIPTCQHCLGPRTAHTMKYCCSPQKQFNTENSTTVSNQKQLSNGMAYCTPMNFLTKWAAVSQRCMCTSCWLTFCSSLWRDTVTPANAASYLYNWVLKLPPDHHRMISPQAL